MVQLVVYAEPKDSVVRRYLELACTTMLPSALLFKRCIVFLFVFPPTFQLNDSVSTEVRAYNYNNIFSYWKLGTPI